MKTLCIFCITILLSVCCAQLSVGKSRQVAAPAFEENDFRFAAKRSDSDSYSSESEDAVYPHQPEFYSLAFNNKSASYDYVSSVFTVPSLPANISNQFLEMAILLQSSDEVDVSDYIGAYLDFGGDRATGGSPSYPLYSIYTCLCPFDNCNCSDTFDVSPGDVITSLIYLQNGVWTASVSSSSGVSASNSLPVSEFKGSMGLVGIQWGIIAVENCNNLPTSNHIDISNIVVKDRGVPQTDIQWVNAYSLSPCSFQLNANDVFGRVSWSSNDWTGTQEGACALGYILTPQNEWVTDGKTYYQYEMEIDNSAWSQNLTGLTFGLDPAPWQTWIVDVNADGSYSLPSYVFPLSAYWPAWSFSFGFITTAIPSLVNVHCTGGESILIGDQPGSPKSGQPVSLGETLGSSGCSVIFQQSVSSTWTDGLGPNVQVNVLIVNNGTSIVSSLDFSAVQASLITSSWAVSSLANNHFGLPTWSPSLAPGASVSFGYIMRSALPADLQISQITCN